MAWRGIHIGKPSRLTLRSHRLVVEQDEVETASIPLEDIGWIVLDTQQVTASAALMSSCLLEGIPVVYSDDRHVPCGVLLPFHRHWRQAGIAHAQIEASEPLKKRLWQMVVRRKLENQAAILDRAQIDGGKTLHQMCAYVKSGDSGNVEARGARFYWQRLFKDFHRRDDQDLRNAMLNYGYAVLRAGVARSLVAVGLLPAFGIHHASAQNAFNLADDLLEVLRPIVDWIVFGLSRQGQHPEEERLTQEHRRHLAGVMFETSVIEGQQLTMLPAIDCMTSTLVHALSGKGVKALRLPSF